MFALGPSMYDLFGHLLAGMEVGIWLAAGYYAQAIGLHTSDASVCAFLCSLTVVSESRTCARRVDHGPRIVTKG